MSNDLNKNQKEINVVEGPTDEFTFDFLDNDVYFGEIHLISLGEGSSTTETIKYVKIKTTLSRSDAEEAAGKIYQKYYTCWHCYVRLKTRYELFEECFSRYENLPIDPIEVSTEVEYYVTTTHSVEGFLGAMRLRTSLSRKEIEMAVITKFFKEVLANNPGGEFYVTIESKDEYFKNTSDAYYRPGIIELTKNGEVVNTNEAK